MSGWNGDDEHLARAALLRCSEPEDASVAVCVEVLGAPRAWEMAHGSAPLADEIDAVGAEAQLRGLRAPQSVLTSMAARLEPRAALAEPARDLRNAAKLGGGLLVPGDEAWPVSLNDLGPGAPLGLWWRGRLAPPAATEGWLAIVGTRDPSAYGLHAARELAATAVRHGAVIVSGGALGVDACAHRSALSAAGERAAGGASGEVARLPADGSGNSEGAASGVSDGDFRLATVAVLAGGIDRLYPASNARLLEAIAKEQLLLSEHPPGCAPTRWRFLSRNRLIAALSGGIVVVEGRWRSGSLSTAHRAVELGRWVGAVPGPVTSSTSEGPHRLIREGAAELLSRPQDALEALGIPGPRGAGAAGQGGAGRAHGQGVLDGLGECDARVFESLPKRGAVPMERLLQAAGVAPREALASLSGLARLGLAVQTPQGWARAAPRA